MSADPADLDALERSIDDSGARPTQRDVHRWVLWLATLAAVVPIVVATVRAIAEDWLPIGDNAYFAIRARDVLTGHHPLLGTWTSASQSLGKDLNNPGPIYFDALALPAKIDGAAGLAVGVAVLNICAVVGILFVARRRGGPVAAAAAMAMSAALVWAMGSELLFDPWQPHALLLPFLLLMTLVWAMASGDLGALPWTAFVASYIVQTHLSYAYLIAALVASGLVMLAVDLRRRRHPGVLRIGVITVAVLAVCWAQPVIEQLTGDGEGNLHRLATAGGTPDTPVGIKLGTRLVASVMALPPFWGRPSFEKALVLLGLARLPSFASAVIALGALALVVVAAGAWAHRRGDELGRSAVLAAAVALIAAELTAVALPLSGFGVAPHQLRWLWPIGAFVTFAVVLVVARRLADAGRTTAAVVGLTAIAVVLGLLSLPAHNPQAGPSADADAIPATRALIAQLGSLESEGPLLLDVRGLRFAEPYSVPVLAELQRRGIEFELDDSGMIRQLGDSRALNEAQSRLVLREGDFAFEPPSGGRVIARVLGLDDRRRDELADLRAEISRYVRESGLRLNDRGRAAQSIDALPFFTSIGTEVRDVDPLIASGEIILIVRERLAPIDPAWRDRFERFSDLQERWDHHTVAVFIAPLEEPS